MSNRARARTQQEFLDQFAMCLDFLSFNLSEYKKGRKSCWLAIPSQLFVLLCDRKSRHLLRRILPDLKLHPLILDITDKHDNDLFFDAVRKKFSPLGIEFELFDLEAPPIPLSRWLDQTFLVVGKDIPNEVLKALPVVSDGAGGSYVDIPEDLIPPATCVTIRRLIKETRHQTGPGHYSPIVDKIILATEGIRIVESGISKPYYEKCMESIADYVVNQLTVHLRKVATASNNPKAG